MDRVWFHQKVLVVFGIEIYRMDKIMKKNKTINMTHGSGGQMSSELMQEIFGKHFSNDILDKLEDGAVLDKEELNSSSIVVSTDSFVVTPIEFQGGNIGKLAVCGTVNDVLMMGAVPKYLTSSFILEEGLDFEVLERIVASMASAASAAKVKIVAGDTKVVEKRTESENDKSGLIINTTGIGLMRPIFSSNNTTSPSATNALPGDVVIVSGNLGDHHACILSERMNIDNGIKSDCADLSELVNKIIEQKIDVHTMRDVTRGGLGTVLNEIASSSEVAIELTEESIPVDAEVRAFCGIMGLDPLYMGNEGKFIVIVPKEDKDLTLSVMRENDLGRNANIIGEIVSSEKSDSKVIIKTKIGGSRRVDMLLGEGLPRIC